jgi:hypothetical protein
MAVRSPLPLDGVTITVTGFTPSTGLMLVIAA